MKKGKVWMLDPDATFKPPGKVKQSFSAVRRWQAIASHSLGQISSLHFSTQLLLN
jgi:hypothetical protein